MEQQVKTSLGTDRIAAVLTAAQVAQALQVGTSTVYEMARGGGPLAHLVVRVGAAGGGIRIRRDGFLEWLNAQGRAR